MSDVLMMAPDGTSGTVPSDQVPAAVKAGGKLGVKIKAPDGTVGTIPIDNVHDAIHAGGQLAPPAVPQPSVNMETSALGHMYEGENPTEETQQAMLDKHPGIKPFKQAGDVLNGITMSPNMGVLKAAGRTAIDVANLPGRALRAAGVNAPEIETPPLLENKNVGESIGGVGENILEFVLGEGELKAAASSGKLAKAAKLAKLLEEYPTLARLAKLGMSATRQAVVGGVQDFVHGASPEEALRSAATTGAVSAGLGGVSEATNAIAPKVKTIASKAIPVRASQESGLARALEPFADSRVLQKFNVNQTQPAVKEAIGNVAREVASDATDKITPVADLGKVNDLKSAARVVKANAQPVFRKLDQLTASEPAMFSDLQATEKSAIRRGDYEAAKTARTQQDALIQKYGDQFGPDDLANARGNWRQAEALEKVHKRIFTKDVLQPTPIDVRPSDVPDPGYINGKAFAKQVLALRNDGSLKAAGLTPDHIQSLQNIGSLLEKSGEDQDLILKLMSSLKKYSVKGLGSSWLLGKMMTNPNIASTLETGLKSGATVRAVSKSLKSVLDSDTNNANQQQDTGSMLGGRRL